MNKKAMELSMNFVVIMILSIAILSSSFILVNQFFGKASEMKARLDSETEAQIRSLLVSGERVAIPLHTREVKQGDYVTFGIGISNILREGPNNDNKFQISVGDINNQNLCSVVGTSTAAPLPTLFSPTIDIDKNDQEIVLIVVDTSTAQRGLTYKCDIEVKYIEAVSQNPVQYSDPVYKAYIKIK